MIEVCLRLGVSQVVLENEYYMVDLPTILKKKREMDALHRLQDLQNKIAANNRGLEEADFKELLKTLNKQSGIKAEEKFDREKFEQLRMFTQMGANKAR